MFQLKRKKTDYFQYRSVRKIAFACIGTIVFSCANQQTSQPLNQSQFCLNASGKGRIKTPNQKVVFSYQSEFKDFQNDDLYKIYFDFVLSGEESFILSKVNIKNNKDKLKWKGTLFVKSISMALKNKSRKQVLELQSFYKNLAQFILSVKKNNFKKNFSTNNGKFHYKNGDFMVVGSLSNHRYKKMKISYKKKFSGYRYQLDLYASECY